MRNSKAVNKNKSRAIPDISPKRHSFVDNFMQISTAVIVWNYLSFLEVSSAAAAPTSAPAEDMPIISAMTGERITDSR